MPRKKVDPAAELAHDIRVNRRELIRIAILRCGKSYTQAAKAFGVGRNSLHRWENQGWMPQNAALKAASLSGIPAEELNPSIDIEALKALVQAAG